MDEKATKKPEVEAKAVEAEVKPEPIVINAEPAAPLLEVKDAKAEVSEPEKVEAKTTEPEKVQESPKSPEPAKTESSKLFSVKKDTYTAWVTQNGDNAYLANLELTTGSAYNWPASSPQEAEALLKYHISNQKL